MMKKYLLTSILLLALALIAVVVVFWLVHTTAVVEAPDLSQEPTAEELRTEGDLGVPAEASDVSSVEASLEEEVTIPESRLSEGQQNVLESIGVDTANFTITPGQVACAEERLPPERIAAILAGDTPTMIEIARLSPCLIAE